MKRKLNYPFKSDFYPICDLFDDAEMCRGCNLAKDIISPQPRYISPIVSADVKEEIILARLLLRKRPELYRPTRDAPLDWKHMTINIDNY